MNINNKFEIDEIAYTTYKKNLTVECPLCRGTGFIYKKIKCSNCTGGYIKTSTTTNDICQVRIKNIKANISDTNTTIKYGVVPLDPDIYNIKSRTEKSLYKTEEQAKNENY